MLAFITRSRILVKNKLQIIQDVVLTPETLANQKDKMTNNDLQNTAQKTKDYKTRTKLKTVFELWNSGHLERSTDLSPLVTSVDLLLKRHEHNLNRKSRWTPVCVNTYK